MKLFWAFMAVLVVVAATVVLLPERRGSVDALASDAALTPPPQRGEARHAGDAVRGRAPASPAPEKPAPEEPALARAPEADATPVPLPAPAPAETVQAQPVPDLDSLLGLEVVEAPALPEEPTPAPVALALDDASYPTADTGAAPQPAPPGERATVAEALPAPADEPPGIKEETLSTESAPPARFRDYEVVPARRRAADGGWLILDERFELRGEGTRQSPYEVTWDYLVSASETFQPRLGKLRLPERLTMLDGKWVRITGYVAFPIMAAAQNEMLSMRNMWDGCCIGVPPTPYDAIEVRLAAAATGRDRFTSFGSVEGKLSVDPYIKGNWLLGLYLMEEARLSQLQEGADPQKHGGI